MSELIDRIPGSESVRARIRGITDTTLQLKARQRLSGRSGQLGYVIGGAPGWDYEASIPVTSGSYDIAEFRITVTGDGTQKFPIVIPELDVRINGTGEANRMVFSPGNHGYAFDSATLSVTAIDYGAPVDDLYEDELKSAWTLRIMYMGVGVSSAMALRIKLRAQASCGGSVAVVRVA